MSPPLTAARLKILMAVVALAVAMPQTLVLAAEKPFKWEASTGEDSVTVRADIPAGFYLYKKETRAGVFDSKETPLALISEPSGSIHNDEILGETEVYSGPGIFKWKFSRGETAPPYTVSVSYQGCGVSPLICYPPGVFKTVLDGKPAGAAPPSPTAGVKSDAGPDAALRKALGSLKISGSGAGYMDAAEFVSFLRGDGRTDLFGGRSAFLIILLVLLGGLALNLTPCVLPMIPVNLAIIGAGGENKGAKGFAVGGVYGLGIALSYGALGIFSALTGSTFGTLNASWIFNAAVAVIFVFLGLAMFGALSVDFSRWSAAADPNKLGKGRLVTAFILGAVSAVLAGACVAPVVIATLLYSASLAAEGSPLGYALPFILGAGMAAPWPLAGAGLAALPKPGKWMLKVKYVFGVLILLAAAYYGWTAFILSRPSGGGNGVLAALSPAAQNAELADALARAKAENKPVLLDFWAEWCKNCKAMDAVTMKNPSVQKELAGFIVFKYRADDPDQPDARAALDVFGVKGFPTFVILRPERDTPR